MTCEIKLTFVCIDGHMLLWKYGFGFSKQCLVRDICNGRGTAHKIGWVGQLTQLPQYGTMGRKGLWCPTISAYFSNVF